MLRHACRLSLEGVISKLRDAPYRSGRGKDWIKSKCSERQEFVVAGYVPSSVSNSAIGSLILGYFEKGKLAYAGRVGTGYSNKVAAELFRPPGRHAHPQEPVCAKAHRRGSPAGAVRPSGTGRGSGIPQLDLRRSRAPRRISGFARRQARRGGRARIQGNGARTAARPGDQAHPSRSALLEGCRRHQAGARRLLFRGLAAHGAVHRQPAARPGALSGRGWRPVFLPETCMARSEQGHPHGERSQGRRRAAHHRHRQPARPHRPRAGRRARNSSMGITAR